MEAILVTHWVVQRLLDEVPQEHLLRPRCFFLKGSLIMRPKSTCQTSVDGKQEILLPPSM